jgi:glycosyltransferase involved in cell wall biosynthesis
MNQFPLVSAVVPIHNHEDFVQEALLSIVNQGYPNLRFVAINDGSTDNSWDNALKLCKNLRKMPLQPGGEPAELLGGNIGNYQIILARLSKNYGPSHSRNYGLETCKDTDIYAFLDADDIYMPGKIQKSVEHFMKYPGLVGTVYSDYVTLNIQTSLECRVWGEPFSREKLVRECIINMDSLISRRAIELAGNFDVNMRVSEDWDMHMRVSEKQMCIHIPEPLVKVRINNPKNTTSRYNQEYWNQCRGRMYEKLQQRQGL